MRASTSFTRRPRVRRRPARGPGLEHGVRTQGRARLPPGHTDPGPSSEPGPGENRTTEPRETPLVRTTTTLPRTLLQRAVRGSKRRASPERRLGSPSCRFFKRRDGGQKGARPGLHCAQGSRSGDNDGPPGKVRHGERFPCTAQASVQAAQSQGTSTVTLSDIPSTGPMVVVEWADRLDAAWPSRQVSRCNSRAGARSPGTPGPHGLRTANLGQPLMPGIGQWSTSRRTLASLRTEDRQTVQEQLGTVPEWLELS